VSKLVQPRLLNVHLKGAHNVRPFRSLTTHPVAATHAKVYHFAHASLPRYAVLVYAREHYGVFDLDDYTYRVAGLQETPRQKLMKIMALQKETRLKREQ
jgi:hypothetical protein